MYLFCLKRMFRGYLKYTLRRLAITVFLLITLCACLLPCARQLLGNSFSSTDSRASLDGFSEFSESGITCATVRKGVTFLRLYGQNQLRECHWIHFKFRVGNLLTSDSALSYRDIVCYLVVKQGGPFRVLFPTFKSLPKRDYSKSK